MNLILGTTETKGVDQSDYRPGPEAGLDLRGLDVCAHCRMNHHRTRTMGTGESADHKRKLGRQWK